MDIYPREEILDHSRGIIYPETFCSPAAPSSSVGEGTYGWCFSDSVPCAVELRGFTEGRGSLGGSLGAVALLSGSETVLEFHTISCSKNEFHSFKKMSLETGAFG